MDNELRRYIEYLQRSQLTPGSEPAHDTSAYREWVAKNRSRSESIAKLSGGTSETVDELDRQLEKFEPQSAYDSVTAAAIFKPMLSRVLDAAREAELQIDRPVLFANSTDVSPSAMARPSSAEHLLFAGVGTYAFCNYWAKAVARIVDGMRAKFGAIPITGPRTREVLAADPTFAREVVKLALHCKLTGTAVGFGVMPGSAVTAPFRLELLRAMETFVIAHEVGHCYFEERGRPPTLNPVAEEFACDQYAIAISRTLGNRHDSLITFSGAGAYLFLRVAAICAPIRNDIRSATESTHPASKARAEAIRDASIGSTAEDQRHLIVGMHHEFQELIDEIEALVDASVQELSKET